MREGLVLDGMLGLAVGDALGAPAEFGERWMRDMDPVRGMRPGGVFDLPEGGWTDDTAMSLATLDSLRGGFDPQDMMKRFLAWLHHGEYSWRGEAIGIGKQILRCLERYEAEGDLSCCGGEQESDNGNGSLMRILPVCLYALDLHDEEAIRLIEAAGSLTHRHRRSQIACGIYYFCVAEAAKGGASLAACLQRGVDRAFRFYEGEQELQHFERLRSMNALRNVPRDEIASTGYVVHSLEAALWALASTESLEAALLKAVNLGEDTDTIAAIAGGLAGVYYGRDSIPEAWLNALQDREWLMGLCADFETSF